jgi:hypothetical protein
MKGGNMKIVLTILFAGGLFAATNAQSDVGEPLRAKPDFDMKLVTRGQYLLKTSGCNDCHTPGYMQSEGKVPDDLWLTGDTFGWRGPWGTTYGSNLRILVDNLSEEQWVGMAKSFKARPPMPWFVANLHHLMYRPIKNQPGRTRYSQRHQNDMRSQNFQTLRPDHRC